MTASERRREYIMSKNTLKAIQKREAEKNKLAKQDATVKPEKSEKSGK